MNEYKNVVSLIAGFLIIVAQARYIFQIVYRKITPTALSWLGWALLMGTSLVSQIIFKGWSLNLIGLSLSTIGCFSISIVSVLLNNYNFKKTDLKFLYYGIICVIIYATAKNVWVTTSFAILADFILGIPTLKNAFVNPAEEKSPAWILAFSSWIFSMIFLTFDFSWIYALWPIYLLLFNATMIYLVYVRSYSQKEI